MLSVTSSVGMFWLVYYRAIFFKYNCIVCILMLMFDVSSFNKSCFTKKIGGYCNQTSLIQVLYVI